MLFAQFLLVSFGCMLVWFNLAHVPNQMRPNSICYFQVKEGDRNPFQPARVLAPFQARARGNYYQAYFDEVGRLSYYVEYRNGKKSDTVTWIYDADGRVTRKLIRNAQGREWVVKFR